MKTRTAWIIGIASFFIWWAFYCLPIFDRVGDLLEVPDAWWFGLSLAVMMSCITTVFMCAWAEAANKPVGGVPAGPLPVERPDHAEPVGGLTICMKCQSVNTTLSDLTRSWSDYRCLHPAVARSREQDPVTGKIQWAERNDPGRVILVDDPAPYCRDINHGNCPHFEAKP